MNATLTLVHGRCPNCGHHGTDHNPGRCVVLGYSSGEGWTDLGPDGCGCTALGTNRTCATCGRAFYWWRDDDSVKDCRQCYENAKAKDEAIRFEPLVRALARVGIAAEVPWNTGGGIMCLAAYLPNPDRPTPEGADAYPYIMFSDYAEWIGFGLYFADDESLGFDPSWGAEYVNAEGYVGGGWDTPGLADRTASWVAEILPAIREWLDREVEIGYSEPRQLFGRTFRDTTARYDRVPEIEGTDVTNFGRGGDPEPEFAFGRNE